MSSNAHHVLMNAQSSPYMRYDQRKPWIVREHSRAQRSTLKRQKQLPKLNTRVRFPVMAFRSTSAHRNPATSPRRRRQRQLPSVPKPVVGNRGQDCGHLVFGAGAATPPGDRFNLNLSSSDHVGEV
jgi:hypothetical protein